MDKAELLQFMQAEPGVQTTDIDETTSLFSSGIIDSFSLVSLITFLEKRYGFRMDPMDANRDILDSIEKMAAYVQRVTA